MRLSIGCPGQALATCLLLGGPAMSWRWSSSPARGVDRRGVAIFTRPFFFPRPSLCAWLLHQSARALFGRGAIGCALTKDKTLSLQRRNPDRSIHRAGLQSDLHPDRDVPNYMGQRGSFPLPNRQFGVIAGSRIRSFYLFLFYSSGCTGRLKGEKKRSILQIF